MTLIFEDKADMPVSKLLSASTPFSCEFSEKSGRLKSLLRKHNTDEEGVMFVDVNPLNSSTVLLFTQLRDEMTRYENMLLVPIVCIEEHVLRMFRCIEGLDSLFNFDDVLVTRKHKSYQDSKSVEVCLKSILKMDTNGCYCLKNRNTERSEYSGLFFKKDCTSDCPATIQGQHCPVTKLPTKLLMKGILLWLSLPVAPVYTSNPAYTSLEQLANDVSAERRQFYTELCSAMGIEVPKWVNNINVYPYSSV